LDGAELLLLVVMVLDFAFAVWVLPVFGLVLMDNKVLELSAHME